MQVERLRLRTDIPTEQVEARTGFTEYKTQRNESEGEGTRVRLFDRVLASAQTRTVYFNYKLNTHSLQRPMYVASDA